MPHFPTANMGEQSGLNYKNMAIRLYRHYRCRGRGRGICCWCSITCAEWRRWEASVPSVRCCLPARPAGPWPSARAWSSAWSAPGAPPIVAPSPPSWLRSLTSALAPHALSPTEKEPKLWKKLWDSIQQSVKQQLTYSSVINQLCIHLPRLHSVCKFGYISPLTVC